MGDFGGCFFAPFDHTDAPSSAEKPVPLAAAVGHFSSIWICFLKKACFRMSGCHFGLQCFPPAQKGDAMDPGNEQQAEIRLHNWRILRGPSDSLIAYAERVCYTLKE